ncbi:Predicted transciptional regulator, contains HTH domain [Natrinema hispanicum]|uniref:Predicted transciptional regulator, contains HTH domain n=2 Tax=Natrinema hispanicum TaxID=392421 RepID=A0A1I0JG57_9EURY|nr:Predicted transciptional regulator, contains HTH domain [Natrinema hispanicum]SEU09107.1 Predicted transciptional regulator, contains HTH domain [Natrinema hispanicum]
MVSRSESERLKLEADTIMTRYQEVEQALERARNEDGEHWETGELEMTLETPNGEEIDVALDLHENPARNAQARYDQVAEREAEQERRQQIADQLDPLPADPVAYLICYHLDAVKGNYPKSIAGHLDAERTQVRTLCKELEQSGLLERVESGTVKQRRVKAKMADEVRQHHTYYRLSRDGDHLLRFLSEREGKVNVLRHLPDGKAIVQRLSRTGPDAPRTTAAEWEMEFEYVRHLYLTLRRVGLVTQCDGEPIDGEARSATDRTYYATTETGDDVLEAVGSE